MLDVSSKPGASGESFVNTPLSPEKSAVAGAADGASSVAGIRGFEPDALKEVTFLSRIGRGRGDDPVESSKIRVFAAKLAQRAGEIAAADGGELILEQDVRQAHRELCPQGGVWDKVLSGINSLKATLGHWRR